MRRSESGFAMLFVFLMAAVIAISMYMSLPRAAFEAQRDKEQTLIDRGEQYKRAIQLYVRQNKRWPAKIEDLESTNGKRYLRKRYVDPMTGKDEWRPIHVGPNGVLTDSLIKPVKKDDGSSGFNKSLITELGGVAGLPEAPGAANPGLRKRPSDQIPAGTGDGSQPVPLPPGQQVAGNGAPGGQTPGVQAPAVTPQQLGQTGVPNLPPGVNVPGGSQTAQGGSTFAGPAVASQSGGISSLGGVGGGSAYSTAPGANGAVQPPMQGVLQGQTAGIAPGQPGIAGTPTNAAQLIQGILTSPRPGGAPGSLQGGSTGQVQGGGIAGFASKFEGEGIKIYNEQTEYQKWEFVYDMSKDPMITGGQQVPQVAGQNGQNGTNPQTPGGIGQGSGAFGQGSTAASPTATTPTVGH
jgi:hypothetical protein